MSMLLALALFGAAAAQPAPDAVQETENPEITVMARKLKNWRGNWKLRDETIKCKTTRSTGDKEIDAIGCAAIVTCLAPHAAEIQAISDSKDDRKTKDARFGQLMGSTIPCMEQARNAGLAALADRRASQ